MSVMTPSMTTSGWALACRLLIPPMNMVLPMPNCPLRVTEWMSAPSCWAMSGSMLTWAVLSNWLVLRLAFDWVVWL